MPRPIPSSQRSAPSRNGRTASSTQANVRPNAPAMSPGKGLRTAIRGKEATVAVKPSGISRRGFASMSPERRREIASRGGRASHGGGRPRKDASNGNSGPRNAPQESGRREGLGRTAHEQYTDPRRAGQNGGENGRSQNGAGQNRAGQNGNGSGNAARRDYIPARDDRGERNGGRDSGAEHAFNSARGGDFARGTGGNPDYRRQRDLGWDAPRESNGQSRDYSPGQYRGPGLESRGSDRQDGGQQPPRREEGQGYPRDERNGGQRYDNPRGPSQHPSGRERGDHFDQGRRDAEYRPQPSPADDGRSSDSRNDQRGRWEGSGDQGARENLGEQRFDSRSGQRFYQGGDNGYGPRAEHEDQELNRRREEDRYAGRGRREPSGQPDGR